MTSVDLNTFPEGNITVSNEIIKLQISKQKNVNSLLESLNLNQEEKKDDVDVKNDNLLSLCHVIGEEGKIRMNNTFKSRFKESKFILIGEGFSESKEWQVKLVFEPNTGKFYFFIISYTPHLREGSSLYQIISDITITFGDVKESYDGLELPLDSDILGPEIDLELLSLETLKKISLDSTSTSTVNVELTISKQLVKEFPIHRLPVEIVISLLESMSLGTASNLIRSSPDLYYGYRKVLTSIASFRIKQYLSKYFQSPTSFIKILKLCKGLIGGSSILHILSNPSTNRKWIPGDLDIILPGDSMELMHNFLREIGYQLTSAKDYESNYSDASFMYFHWIRSDGRKIDVCGISCMRPVDHILTYHSTPPMNYYDGTKLVCLFPEYTFNSTLLRNKFTVDRTYSSETAIRKYIRRGYKPPRNKKTVFRNGEGIIQCIQDLPRLISDKVIERKEIIKLQLGKDMLDVWGVDRKDFVVEEEVAGKWFLNVELSEDVDAQVE